MKKYEALIIFNMKGQESSVEELTKSIVKDMTSFGANVSGTKDQGRREFVYESNHTTSGQYVVISFEAEATAIKPIREHLSINTVVHQQYYKAL